jgi:hypothetical protein
MALKHLGQSVRQVAGKAFARSLAQLESQFGARGREGAAHKTYVVRAFFPPAEKRVKEFFRSFRRKDAVKKGLFKSGHGFSWIILFLKRDPSGMTGEREFRLRLTGGRASRGLRPQAV